MNPDQISYVSAFQTILEAQGPFRGGQFSNHVIQWKEVASDHFTLEFVVHPTKSALIASQRLELLGFILDLSCMTAALPDAKIAKISALRRQV